MKKNKISVYQGTGSFDENKLLSVIGADGKKQTISFKSAIIATGSKPSSLPFIKIDGKRIITSTEALSLKEVPKRLIVIGAGVIGLEMGSVYARLGSKVEVIEFADAILPTMEPDLGKELGKVLKKEGFSFRLNHRVTKVSTDGKQVKVEALDAGSEKNVVFEADYCLVAVGRHAYTESLGLDKIGCKTDKFSKVIVNERLETSIPGIYAIGDVIAGPMLAHKAEEEGVFVAEQLAGQKPHINYNLIPGVVYTWPEIASVGHTSAQLKADKVPFKTGKFPFKASGRAQASMDTDGFVKVLSHKETDEILGVHMLGPRASDMIAQAVTAMEFRASAEDIARTCHAHPTFSEAIKEACLDATEKRAIHT